MKQISNNELVQLIIKSPIGSAFYFDISEQDRATLQLLNFKISALESLFQSLALTCSREYDDKFILKKIVDNYAECIGSKTGILSYWITKDVGDTILCTLSNPCWTIGYDNQKEKIFLKKVCPSKKRYNKYI